MRVAVAAARAFGLALWSLVLYATLVAGLAMHARAPERRSRWQGRVFSAWSRGVLRLLGARVEWDGEPPHPPFLLVANHLSYVDIFTLGSRLPASFIAKSEIARWPVVGHLCRVAGTIFVDRERKRDVPRVLAAIRMHLDRGRGVVFFPEGRAGRGDVVQPFRPPLLELPAALGMPVHAAALGYAVDPRDPPVDQVVCWWGTMPFGGHFWRLLQLRRIEATVRIAPITAEAADRKDLADALWVLVAERFQPVATDS